MMLAVIALYAVINFIVQTLDPAQVRAATLPTSRSRLTVLALVFWGWVLGPLGAFLALPLTLLAKAALVDIDPSTRWVDSLIASTVVDPAEEEEHVDRRISLSRDRQQDDDGG